MEINPQWKHAIEMNNCPFCGQSIMEEQLKILFNNLRETMDALKDYPAQLNDWMLSNHNYIKTDSEKLANFVSKDLVKTVVKEAPEKTDNKYIVKFTNESGVEEEVVAERIQTEEKTNEFFKRAEVVKSNQSPTEKNQHLKNIIQQIKRGGAPAINEAGVGSIISPEMMANADPEAVAEWNNILNSNDPIAPTSSMDGGDDDIPAAVLAMANKSSNKNPTANAADMIKLHQLQNRVSSSRANFESGDNRGKNGFSRSS
jgi:hypothetical protein